MIDFFAPTPHQKIWEDYWKTQRNLYDYLPLYLFDMVRFACEKAFYAGYELGRSE
jgi:hypothetical protein